MCQTHSTIGPGGDFTTLDAWVDAISNWAWSADGRCIAGANLGNFVPPAISNVMYWQLEPATDADRHTGQDDTGCYGVSCIIGNLVSGASVTGIRWAEFSYVSMAEAQPGAPYVFDGCLFDDMLMLHAATSATFGAVLRNNLFFGARTGPAIMLQADGGGTLTAALENNTVYANNTLRTGLIQAMATDYTIGGTITGTLTNNLVMDTGATPGPILYVISNAPSTVSLTGDSNIDNDPGPNAMPGTNRQYSTPAVEFLHSGTNTDATLGPLAVSRHSGANLSSEFTTDGLAAARPADAAWSRGAIEYVWTPEVIHMGVKLGWEGKLYYCTGGIGGTPTWNLITNVRDVTGPGERSAVDVTTRAGAGVKLEVGGQLDGGIEFEMVYDPADAAMLALQTAFQTNVPIGMAWMDGPIATAGSKGLWADMAVLSFKREEPLDKEMVVKVKVSPTLTANPPIWKTIGS